MPNPTERLILREQLRHLVRQTPFAVLAAVLMTALFALIVYPHVERSSLLVWTSVALLAAALRIGLATWLRPRLQTLEDPRRYLRAFVPPAFLSGAGWGLAGFYYLRPDRPLGFAASVLALSGSAVGAVGSLGHYLPAYLAFSLAALLPLTALFTGFGGAAAAGTLVLSLAFLALVVVNARAQSRTLRDSARLRFRNEQLVEELTREKEHAEAAVLAKSKFLAAASHDLRQPAHALSLFVHALEQRSGGDADLRFIADRIGASSRAMKALLDGLLDVSRLDAGVVTAHARPVPLAPLLQRIADELQPAAAHKGLTLRFRPTSAWAHTDPELLERMVRNLLTNALRYTQRGKILVGVRAGAPLRLCIFDTGPGIPRDQLEAIFDEFVQLHNPERDREKGLGLGLAIVRRLGALLHHRVHARSEPGRGSCFVIELPRAPAGRTDDTAAPGTAPPGFLDGRTVVVIDDEPLGRDAMRALVEAWGGRALCAGSGEDAAALVSGGVRVDLVIADYRLRGAETGFGAVARVHGALGAKVPTLLVTGDTAPDRIRDAEATGHPLLHKPVTGPALFRAVERALAPRAIARDRPSP